VSSTRRRYSMADASASPADSPVGSGIDLYAGTDPMSVDDPNFLLERLGNDCSDMQVYRELTENSIQAIEAAVRIGMVARGEIEWDYDPVYFKDTGFYKLCITDTGIGMSGQAQVQNINRLTAVGGGKVRGHSDNFGIGAKIAGVTRNHRGLVYLSWSPGSPGAMTCLWRDPKTGHYGLQRFRDGDGVTRSVLDLDDSVKPELIGDHGTKVTLLGMTQEHDTTEAPPDVTARSRWLARYLNSRYFELPDYVTIKVREGFKTGSPSFRRLTGMRDYLLLNSTADGVLDLTGARAYWWVLDDGRDRQGKIHDSPINQNSNFIESAGHLGALYEGEVYESFTQRAAYGPLQDFGVIFGARRVVIYVEPLVAGVQSNTARTSLRINGDPLPWHEWAEEFRAKMPDAIKEMMEEVAAGTVTEDHHKAIRDRLKSIRELFSLTRYKPTPTGSVFVDPNSPTIGGRPSGNGSPTTIPTSNTSTGGGRTGNVYARHQAPKGTRANEVDELPEINVRWVSVTNGTRNSGDMEDRAGKYIRDQNLLLINGDFRGVTDLVKRWKTAYKAVVVGPNMEEVILDAVREWHEQALVETVLGALALEGSPEWTTEQLGKALSEEALTAACLARYHVDMAVKRTLGQRLQSLAKT
jgi:hypothetical protein